MKPDNNTSNVKPLLTGLGAIALGLLEYFSTNLRVIIALILVVAGAAYIWDYFKK